jgi:hypothetical protein
VSSSDVYLMYLMFVVRICVVEVYVLDNVFIVSCIDHIYCAFVF